MDPRLLQPFNTEVKKVNKLKGIIYCKFINETVNLRLNTLYDLNNVNCSRYDNSLCTECYS